MITIESRTRGIKFERHKEESLISSQFMKNQKKSKASHFLIFIQWFLENVYRLRSLFKGSIKLDMQENIFSNNF